MGRCMVLEEKINKAIEAGFTAEVVLLESEYVITDKIRMHLKNVLLWDTSRGK